MGDYSDLGGREYMSEKEKMSYYVYVLREHGEKIEKLQKLGFTNWEIWNYLLGIAFTAKDIEEMAKELVSKRWAELFPKKP